MTIIKKIRTLEHIFNKKKFSLCNLLKIKVNINIFSKIKNRFLTALFQKITFNDLTTQTCHNLIPLKIIENGLTAIIIDNRKTMITPNP